MADELRRLPSEPPRAAALEDVLGKPISDAIRLCAMSQDARAGMCGRILLALILSLAQREDLVLAELHAAAMGEKPRP